MKWQNCNQYLYCTAKMAIFPKTIQQRFEIKSIDWSLINQPTIVIIIQWNKWASVHYLFIEFYLLLMLSIWSMRRKCWLKAGFPFDQFIIVLKSVTFRVLSFLIAFFKISHWCKHKHKHKHIFTILFNALPNGKCRNTLQTSCLTTFVCRCILFDEFVAPALKLPFLFRLGSVFFFWSPQIVNVFWKCGLSLPLPLALPLPMRFSNCNTFPYIDANKFIRFENCRQYPEFGNISCD